MTDAIECAAAFSQSEWALTNKGAVSRELLVQNLWDKIRNGDRPALYLLAERVYSASHGEFACCNNPSARAYDVSRYCDLLVQINDVSPETNQLLACEFLYWHVRDDMPISQLFDICRYPDMDCIGGYMSGDIINTYASIRQLGCYMDMDDDVPFWNLIYDPVEEMLHGSLAINPACWYDACDEYEPDADEQAIFAIPSDVMARYELIFRW